MSRLIASVNKQAVFACGARFHGHQEQWRDKSVHDAESLKNNIMGCNSMVRVVMEDMYGYRDETSKLRHIQLVESFLVECVFRERKRRSPQTSARQRLQSEYRQSGTGSVVINADGSLREVTAKALLATATKDIPPNHRKCVSKGIVGCTVTETNIGIFAGFAERLSCGWRGGKLALYNAPRTVIFYGKLLLI